MWSKPRQLPKSRDSVAASKLDKGSVIEADLSFTQITDAGLQNFRGLSQLRSLKPWGTPR